MTSIFISANPAKRLCEICVQLVEHQLKEQAKQEGSEASQEPEVNELRREESVQEPDLPLVEQHKQLKLQLRATTGSLKEKLNAKESQLKQTELNYSAFESAIKQKYQNLFEALKEVMQGRRQEFGSYLRSQLEKNKERVEEEKEVSHRLIKDFQVLKPFIQAELRGQKLAIQQKEEVARLAAERQKEREVRKVLGTEMAEPEEEVDEGEGPAVDSSKIQALNSITEHFEYILTKNFCSQSDFSDFSFVQARSKEQIAGVFAAFEAGTLRGDFKARPWFVKGVLPRVFQAMENQSMFKSQKLLTNNQNVLFLKNKFSLPNRAAQICTPEGNFYLNGGYLASVKLFLSNHFFFDEYRETLVNRAHMLHPRASHQAVMVNGFLYAIGGISDEKPVGTVEQAELFCQRTVERYNFPQDKWTEMAQVNLKRCSAGACSFSDRYIFLFGGKSLVKGRHYEFVKEIEMYDIAQDVWNVLPYVDKQHLTLLQPGAQQVSSNKIMVFGGLVPEVDDEEQPCAEKEPLSEDGLRTEVSRQVLEVDVSTGAVEVREALPEGQFFFPGTYSFIH